MKKSLLAVAAIGAFASAAQAQSSVTVYGILDVGYVGTSSRVGGSGTVMPDSLSKSIPNAKTQTNGFVGNGAETTSRLGFKGTEDLGGGTSAFFTVELAITPQSEQAVSTSATQNRQTFVGLKKNGIGAASIGTQYTSIHRAVALTDPGQQNNVVGNVIYPSQTGTFGIPGNNNTSSYTVRTNNMLFAESDTFAGFKVNGFLTQNNNNTNQATVDASKIAGENNNGYTGGTTNNQAWGLSANYTWQKLFVTANYQSMNSKSAWSDVASIGIAAPTATNAAVTSAKTVTNTYSGYPTAWINSSGGTNVKDNQQYYAATYDFGILKAYAGYINRKAVAQQDSTYYANRTAQQIGVRSFVTPTVEAWASIGNGRTTSFGDAAPTSNFNGWQLGSNYLLSKRTNLYAIYGQTVSSTANFSSTANINSAVSQYALGVRHTF